MSFDRLTLMPSMYEFSDIFLDSSLYLFSFNQFEGAMPLTLFICLHQDIGCEAIYELICDTYFDAYASALMPHISARL